VWANKSTSDNFSMLLGDCIMEMLVVGWDGQP